MDKTWTAEELRREGGQYSVDCHSRDIAYLAANQLDRITALESDAEVDVQIIRDKDAEIERLKAEVALIRACASSRLDEITRLKLDAILLEANTPTRQPLREMPEVVEAMIQRYALLIDACGCDDGEGNTCDDCGEDRCAIRLVRDHYSPRGGEGESGGHEERP